MERSRGPGSVRPGERERLAGEFALVRLPLPLVAKQGKAVADDVHGGNSFFADLDRFWRPDFTPDQQVRHTSLAHRVGRGD